MAGIVSGIPDGFHSVTPHLIVRGADAALSFYKKAFGAEEILRMPGPDGKTIMHAEIRIGDSVVMLAVEMQAMGCPSPLTLKGTCATIHLYVANADSLFKRAVDAGATVEMPPADMFWGDRYGKVVDPFGHKWGIATRVRNPTPEQMAKDQAAFFASMAGGKPGK